MDWDNYYVSSWVKARATDYVPARWSPRKFTFGPNVTDHPWYRVSVLMRWYYPYPSKTNVDGSALDVFQWYRQEYSTGSSETTEGYCYSSEL